MNRLGLTLALALAFVVGLVFGIFPELDLWIASQFVNAGKKDFTFGLRFDPTVLFLRNSAMWLVAALLVPFVAAAVWKLLRPDRPMFLPGRAALFLSLTLALAPGLLVNAVLKDHWSRPRPVDVSAFGGNETFVPWWDPRGNCDKNCSFVSGDVAGAFWTLAPAALTPPAWRAFAYAGALAFGSAVGILRIMAGGHFFSDVFFAGFFTFIVIWLCYALIYRWPRTRLSDAAVEDALGKLSLFRPRGRASTGANTD